MSRMSQKQSDNEREVVGVNVRVGRRTRSWWGGYSVLIFGEAGKAAKPY